MTFDPSSVIAATGLLLGGLIWLVRLEGRVNVTDWQYREIISRLERIERRQDKAGDGAL